VKLSPPAFPVLFQENVAYVWRVLLGLGVAEKDAEDVCQEVFVALFRKIDTYDGTSSLRTWMYCYCLRMASDYRKRAHVQRETPLDEQASAVARSDTLLHNLLPRELARLVEQALATLDENKRATFVLYEIEGCTLAEIAVITETSVPTAHARLQAARRRVIALVTPPNDEEGLSS